MLDAIRSISRVGTALAAVAADQTRARIGHFPTRATDIDPRWLEKGLAARFPGVRIRDHQLLDDHSGTTSRARIGLEYDCPGEADTPPETVFLKITPHAPIQRLFLATFGIGRNEVRFYRDIRPGLPVRAPDVYGICALPGDRQFVLLLEDLTRTGVLLASLGDRATLEQAEAVIDALASLHAAYWECDRFHADLAWVPSYEKRRHRDLPWERFITGQMCERALRRHGADFPPEFEQIARTCIDRRDHLERLWAEGSRTLVHGDCHLGNLFFEDARTGFFDWQICARAPGMRDVSYFMCNSLPEKLRQQHERALIERYLEALRGRDVPAPDMQGAWRQHRLFALYTWISAAFTIAGGEGMQPLEIGLAGVRRATRAAIDLESVACAQESR
ncbi:MAG: phosphotransferase [Deltaproteobacteria bacterium]|nr:phosphotransferase [Deltaproteobacteria bacterium]MBW2694949.1 phosphotransferase [Deltaproteobacteria bacterium]